MGLAASLETRHIVARALWTLPADDPDLRVELAPAIKGAFDESTGWQVFYEWQTGARRFPGEQMLRDIWAAARPAESLEPIYEKARARGWRQPYRAASPDSIARQQEREAAAEKRRIREEQGYLRAAKEAGEIIAHASLEPHPYLAAKGFPSPEAKYGRPSMEGRGLVLGGRLVVPMRNHESGAVTAVQWIDEDGGKRFGPAGCRVGGSVFRLGQAAAPAETWWVEGYATGLSVLRALGRFYRRRDQVVVCFSAANLVKVARGGIVIADHDASGVGEEKARETGLAFWMPPDSDTDANDYEMAYGTLALAEQLNALALANRRARLDSRRGRG